ncbi:class I SAM-dependent methyltransferase [Streptomyces samsunensis]|uniref:Class I SAM-dependent methyltransferase n=1 Tax=Streptomyces malaysiensis TaxID=92644 RepID=A0ABX6WE80_STRMQ|nr:MULTISPECIES: class I SAM-dependent methyltransferase [Streptomyces]MCQ6247311.1 class I SAM-dependent methyltransferase [Streptomyces malaysiensis]NUH41012.1 class I SAM-dependent methyltransferase [Streptomyces samsunensis]QPI59743.1 class I SAM-dependent methyltransferase [Streptomyces solisilvae]UHH21413.1 class I SAM-dependent methyltransferase [Streptomyces sp. HNM0561]
MRLHRVDDSALRHVDNIYYDGLHYDQRYATYTHDIEFWCDIARSNGGPVLELAAGTGRLSLPIADLGIDVVGLDVAPSMVDRAVRKREPSSTPTFLVGDMRRFELDRHFGLVMIACSSVCHLLSDEDALSCFTSAGRHMRPDGIFAIDVATPRHETAQADAAWKSRFTYAHPVTGQKVAVRGRRTYSPGSRLLTDEMEYTFAANGRTECATRLSRMYSAEHLIDLLARAGLRVERTFGDFDGSPLVADSKTQILICSLGGPGRTS